MFVYHSLGGLVCEDALSKAQQRPEGHLKQALQCARSILFLGTPHHGSGLARWAEVLVITIGVLKQTNSDMLAALKSDLQILEAVQNNFHTMFRSRIQDGRSPIEITCFFEELPVSGVGIVAPAHSAVLPAYILIGIRRGLSSSAPTGPVALLTATVSPSITALEHELRTAPDINITEPTGLRRNALHIAASTNRPQNVSLLRAGVNIHATVCHPKGRKKFTPLELAVLLGHVEVLKVFIERGNADVNEQDCSGFPPLHIAAIHGQLGSVEVLLANGADPRETMHGGLTPLNFATSKDHEEVIRVLTATMDSAHETMLESTVSILWSAIHSFELNDHLKIRKFLKIRNKKQAQQENTGLRAVILALSLFQVLDCRKTV